MILGGVRALAEQVLDPRADPVASPAAAFERARSLSVTGPTDLGHGVRGVVSAFPGPHHLAALLVAVAREIGRSAVSRIAVPPSVDPTAWADALQQLVRSRPLLWKNHRQAIDNGFLLAGVSSVVAFPTGAGKSMLAELKINTTLLSGKRVVFLAPTNALVDQTAQNLQEVFPGFKVKGKHAEDADVYTGEEDLPQLLVLTPEAWLTQIGLENVGFRNVGLLIFDECHLMHASGNPADRRPIDAMLCLVGFALDHPEADLLLLSAMMRNSGVMAGWVRDLTGRPCLTLDLAWKPTRQLRGSVVYGQRHLNRLTQRLDAARPNRTTISPPAPLKRELTTRPLAFFSLRQTWETRNKNDYVLVSLGDDAVTLGANPQWKLIPNSVDVSAKLAVSAAKSGMRVLVFFQSVRNAKSAADKIATALGPADISLEPEDRRRLNTASLELGGTDHLYLAWDNDRATTYAGVHHGLLLPEERRVCEALYKRDGGFRVLAATSTVAQGMNFPCELVIIGEDSRFNQEIDTREVLDAQELLNAAGRAGRAGEHAAGIVLIVPGKVVGIDLEGNTIGAHWTTLQEIFGQSDQCLDIDDPLTAVLDRVHADIHTATEIDRYAVARLASEVSGQTNVERLSQAVGRTLGAYKATLRDDTSWLDGRTAAAVQYMISRSEETEESVAVDNVAARFGLSIELVRRMSHALEATAPSVSSDIPQWVTWFFWWAAENPDLLEQVFGRQNLVGLFGVTFERCRDDRAKARLVRPVLESLTAMWLKGNPLKALEAATGTAEHKVGQCIKARRFALQLAPRMAHVLGLPSQLEERTRVDKRDSSETSHAKNQLNRCVRIGLDSYEKAAISQVLPTLSRRRVHMKYSDLQRYLLPRRENETWDAVTARVEQAVAAERGKRL